MKHPDARGFRRAVALPLPASYVGIQRKGWHRCHPLVTPRERELSVQSRLHGGEVFDPCSAEASEAGLCQTLPGREDIPASAGQALKGQHNWKRQAFRPVIS